ncbi:hypothetical protein QQY66_25650 [Streptomyces sp. DG2A-72]|uniref:hypothetical protein n=1 Tax=Streptomyces sp. DG2A-72 TaxID=3051386 RepID=UPI00265BDBB8|nr:hypothetical protein [Streptomyces sp. DG2A-72]MDO0934893.1 hypothetical protein [Streptomyces sp. DG2A-72]
MIGSRITAEALSRGHEVTAATCSGRTALPPDPADGGRPGRHRARPAGETAAGYDTALVRDAMTQSGRRLTGELTQAGKTVRSAVGNGTVFLTTSAADVSGPRDETVAGTATGTAEKRARTSPESLPGAFLVRPTEAAGGGPTVVVR